MTPKTQAAIEALKKELAGELDKKYQINYNDPPANLEWLQVRAMQMTVDYLAAKGVLALLASGGEPKSCGKYNHQFGNMDTRRPRVCPDCGALETETEEAKERSEELVATLTKAHERSQRTARADNPAGDFVMAPDEKIVSEMLMAFVDGRIWPDKTSNYGFGPDEVRGMQNVLALITSKGYSRTAPTPDAPDRGKSTQEKMDGLVLLADALGFVKDCADYIGGLSFETCAWRERKLLSALSVIEAALSPAEEIEGLDEALKLGPVNGAHFGTHEYFEKYGELPVDTIVKAARRYKKQRGDE